MAVKLLGLERRFMKDSSPVRLGNIASDLLRLSKLVRFGSFDTATFDGVLMEVKLFTEWAASGVDLQKQKKILSLQRTMADWSLGRPFKGGSNKIRKDSMRWSRSILEISGLLKEK